MKKSLIFGPLLAASTTLTPAVEILHAWEFDDPSMRIEETFGCEVTIEDGVLKGEVVPSPGVFFILPAADIQAPAKLKIRVRTDEKGFGTGELYWLAESDDNWDGIKFRRFFVPHNAGWQEIEVGIPETRDITQIRLMVGWKPSTFEIDYVRVESDPIPESIQAGIDSLPDSIMMETDAITARLDTQTELFTFTDMRTGRDWIADGSDTKAYLYGAKTTDDGFWELKYWDNAEKNDFTVRALPVNEEEIDFIISSPKWNKRFYSMNTFPPMLRSEDRDGRVIFCDRSAGVYYDQREETYAGALLSVYGNTSASDMPWIGFVDPDEGDGYMLTTKTPWDTYFHIAPDENGLHWPRIRWEESMDSMGYTRVASYRFSDKGSYPALAKKYREFFASRGKLITLREKAEKKPNVNLLPGAPMIWGGTDAWHYVQEARQEGILRGVISNAHHGINDVSTIRKINDLGYITTEYDALDGLQEGPTGFNTDNVEETAIHLRPGLGPMKGWEDDLWSLYTRSTFYSLRAQKVYVPPSMELHGFNGRFVDVAMAISLWEDYHPYHMFDRRQDMSYRRECFMYLNTWNLVLGTEHGNDWGVDLIEFTEGGLSGPFYWLHGKEDGWDIKNLKPAEKGAKLKEPYLKYNFGYDTRIPLWQLALSDCVVSSNYWGDTAGVLYKANPEISDRKDIRAILYGGIPLFWRDKAGYGWNEERARFMQTYLDTSPWHEVIAFEEMLNHEFLTPDYTLQRTTFTGGHTAVVNFGEDVQSYTDSQNRTVEIPKYGFYVESPAITHQRTLEDTGVVTRSIKEGFRRYISPERVEIDGVSLDGSFLAFRIEEDRWQLRLDENQEYTFDPVKLTGMEAPLALVEVDKTGTIKKVLNTVTDSENITLNTEGMSPYYAIIPVPDNPIVVYPSGETVNAAQPIILSTYDPSLDIQYRLGSSDWNNYSAPVSLQDSAVLEVAIADNGNRIGDTIKRALTLEKTLFETDLIKGGDPAIPVSVDVSGMQTLILRVGNGGDNSWTDWADYADARLTTQGGEVVYLTDLNPTSIHQSTRTSGFDEHPTGGKIRIAEKEYDRGLALNSEAEVVYTLDQKYEKFEAIAGVDDRANPGPDGPHQLLGTVTFQVDARRPAP